MFLLLSQEGLKTESLEGKFTDLFDSYTRKPLVVAVGLQIAQQFSGDIIGLSNLLFQGLMRCYIIQLQFLKKLE